MPINGMMQTAPMSRAAENGRAAEPRSGSGGQQLSMNGFLQLLATQLQNQDMNSPMSNSEMMAQLTQMAMMQSIQDSSQISITTYGASLVGREVSMVEVDEVTGAVGGEKVGVVTSVNLFTGAPSLYLDGGEVGYPISRLMSVHEKGYGPKPEKPDKPENPDAAKGPGMEKT